MPWTSKDAEKHIKGLTDKQSQAWAKVANSVRTRCIKGGGTEDKCDEQAIKSANAAAKRIKEADVGKEDERYAGVDDLPDSVAEKYSKAALEVFRKTVNTALAKDDDEDKAFKAAHAAARKKDGLGAAPGGMGLGLQKTGSRKIKESDLSQDETRQRLSAALKIKLAVGDVDGPWVRDVFDDHLIYEIADKNYRMDYSVDDSDVVTVGEPVEVERKIVYEPVTPASTPAIESESLISGDVIPLNEKAVSSDGNLELKIIQPGWGNSGFYSQKMLERDAGIYKPGTQMYWNHPTASEDRERPERSLRDLAAELTTAGQFKEGPYGPGVYARAKVFGPYKEAIEELAPHIGISHRVLGKAVKGEAESKKGPIIEKMVAAKSVDFVTTPGAGGEIVQLFEAARDKAHDDIDWSSITMEGLEANRPDLAEAIKTSEEAKRMSKEELTELKEAKGELEEAKTKLEEENARLKESAILREARDLASDKVGESDLPEITKTRLIETLAKSPVLKEGALD